MKRSHATARPPRSAAGRAERAGRWSPGPARPTLLLRGYGVLDDMRKQARRLWFGDWQHDQEPAPDADTVVITPDDDGFERPPRSARWNARRAVAAGAAVAILFVLALSLFSGKDAKRTASQQSQDPLSQTPPAQTPQVPQTQVPQNQVPPGFGGPDLTGTAAA